MSEADPILELDALLDPARLATAWQVARERPPAAVEIADADPGSDDPAAEAPAPEALAPEALAPEDGEPARAAPLPVAVAHRQLQGEIERTLAASPGLAARARRVLAVPLAQLGAVIDSTPVDLDAAEAALDQLEDVLQALLSDAGWPESRSED